MLTMALGSFAIGTTEFVSMGLLNTIAEDFQISENEAGVIISAYAIGVVVGAPLITVFTGLVPRRRLLLLLMAAFMLGNVLSVVAATYEMLIVARFIAGLPHGALFFGGCFVRGFDGAGDGARPGGRVYHDGFGRSDGPWCPGS